MEGRKKGKEREGKLKKRREEGDERVLNVWSHNPPQVFFLTVIDNNYYKSEKWKMEIQ